MVRTIHFGAVTLPSDQYAQALKFFQAIGAEWYLSRRFAGLIAPGASLTLQELRTGETSKLQPVLSLYVTNPEFVKGIAESMRLGTSAAKEGSAFSVKFGKKFRLQIIGASHDKQRGLVGVLDGKGLSFGIIVSRFNAFITERLLEGTIDALRRSGTDNGDIDIIRVPGSFEIPSAARTLAETRKYDAIICLGCLLRGDTAHYDVIVNEVTRGIGQSAQETGVPHAFGVLTCDTLEQAIDRAGLKMGNKGFEAALAAVEMANLKKAVGKSRAALGSRTSALGKSKTVARRRSSTGLAKKSAPSRSKRKR